MRDEPALLEEIRAVVNLLQVASWLENDLERALQTELGLSHAEYEVMMQLLQHGSRLPLSELADLTLFSQSGITRLLDRLERKNLAVRELSKQDRRLIFATLTTEGRKRLQSAMPLVRSILRERFGRHLSSQDVLALRSGLLKVISGNGWLDTRQVSHQQPVKDLPPSGQASRKAEPGELTETTRR